MTARQVQNKTRVDAEVTKEWYFVFFESEGTYSITSQEFVKGDPNDLVIGGPIKVRDGKKIFTGKLVSQGPKDGLESLQATMEGCLSNTGTGTTSKDVLRAKYGSEKINKYYQQVMDACNQKCRDAKRRIDVGESKNL